MTPKSRVTDRAGISGAVFDSNAFDTSAFDIASWDFGEEAQASASRTVHIEAQRVANIENDDRVSALSEQSRVAVTSTNLRLVTVDGQRVVESSNNERIIVVED